jgi:glycosyltransferase involved in cell wall biosynthesis
MGPRVSIIVTCFEQGRWIVECLEGIRAQTFTDWELVVADDVSTDDTRDVVERWLEGPGADLDARLVVSPVNVGLTAILNLALGECVGELVAYCGGDDVWHPTKLERQVEALDAAGPSTAMVYSDARWIDEDGGLLCPSQLRELGHDPAPAGAVFDQLVRGNFMIASTALYRRSAVEAAGGWDPDLYYEDWDLFLRLAEHHQVAAVDEPLIDYRVHQSSMSRRSISPMLESRLRLLAKWLGRDEATDAHLYPFLQEQSWRLYKVHPDLGREHVAVAYASHTDAVGRLRRLVATSRVAEGGFEVLRRVSRPFRRTEPPPRSA